MCSNSELVNKMSLENLQYTSPSEPGVSRQKTSCRTYIIRTVLLLILAAAIIGIIYGIVRYFSSPTVYPVLRFHPTPNSDRLIEFRKWNETEYMRYVSELNEWTEPYYNSAGVNKGALAVQCTNDQQYSPPGDTFCSYDIASLGVCNKQQYFQYNRGSACILLYLNTEEDWVPEFYNNSNDVPSSMPTDLIYHIGSSPVKERNTIWVTCEGEYPTDVNRLGYIRYEPKLQGFPGYYFPEKSNLDGYLKPLLALHITGPLPGYVINIQCKAWAKNINHNKGMGNVRFKLSLS